MFSVHLPTIGAFSPAMWQIIITGFVKNSIDFKQRRCAEMEFTSDYSLLLSFSPFHGVAKKFPKAIFGEVHGKRPVTPSKTARFCG